MELQRLLEQHESSCVEFKQRLPAVEQVAELLCAFANTAGGDLVVGVEDKTRKVVGIAQEDALLLEEQIAGAGATHVAPLVFPMISVVQSAGKHMLIAHVEAGYQRPYRVTTGRNAGKVFVRIGSTTRVADAATIEMMELQARGLSWDQLPCPECRITDLDRSLLSEYARLRHARRGLPVPASFDEPWLRRMRFATGSHAGLRPTRAAVLLFAPEPQQYYPQAGLEMARFRGAEARDFLDKRSAAGPIWKLYDEALAFLRRNLPIEAERRVEGRIERLAYPEAAFREFLVNALCHRVYAGATGPVRLAVFDDVVEITSPGALPDGLEARDLGTGISVVRNPVIARAFSEMGLIEGWGTGIRLAQRELAARRLPPAQLLSRGFFFQVSSPWRWKGNLAERDTMILQMAAAKGSVTSSQVAAGLGCTERTARRYLAGLVKRSLLGKRGGTKGSTYVLA